MVNNYLIVKVKRFNYKNNNVLEGEIL